MWNVLKVEYLQIFIAFWVGNMYYDMCISQCAYMQEMYSY